MKPMLPAVLATALLLAGAQGRADSDDARAAVDAPSRVAVVNGATVIRLDAAALAQNGIETAVPALREQRPQLRAYAAVLDPGPLTELHGRHAAAKARLESAEARLAASQTAFERARGLYQDGRNASLAELQAAEAAYRADLAGRAAARAALESVAAGAQQAWGAVLARSLVAGTPLVKRLIARRELLLQVTLPPGSALDQPPARAWLETGRHRRAAIGFVSPAPRTDPRIQGASYFYTVPAASGVLPGMELLARLPSGRPVAGAVIPAQAVVWWQDSAWVYRRSAPGSFARVRIATGQPTSGGGYLVRGLEPGSEIVTRGAQFLLSEEFRAGIRVGD